MEMDAPVPNTVLMDTKNISIFLSLLLRVLLLCAMAANSKDKLNVAIPS